MNPADLDLLALPSVSFESSSSLPESSAVYLAIDGHGAVQYVGGTSNLRQRWRQHHRREEVARMQSARIAYIDCPLDQIEEIETALIRWFKPPLNQGVRKYRVIRQLNSVKNNEKDTLIKRLSTSELQLRYKLKSRTALLTRITLLGIEMHREGRIVYVSEDAGLALDTLNECLKRPNSKLDECVKKVNQMNNNNNTCSTNGGVAISRPGENSSKSSGENVDGSTTQSLAQAIEMLSSRLLIFQDPLGPLKGQMEKLRFLQEICDNQWFVPTPLILELLELDELPELRQGDFFERRGFVFQKAQYQVEEDEWEIYKL